MSTSRNIRRMLVALAKKCADGVKAVKTKKEKENLTLHYQKYAAAAK